MQEGLRPRVLIVEEDPVLSLATVNECLKIGLEPKLCLGVEAHSSCPGLVGEECPRTHGIEATLVSIATGRQRMVAPACVGGRLLLSGERLLVGAATRGVLHPDAVIDYPYDPHSAALLLFSMVMDERRRRAWDSIRHVQA